MKNRNAKKHQKFGVPPLTSRKHVEKEAPPGSGGKNKQNRKVRNNIKKQKGIQNNRGKMPNAEKKETNVVQKSTVSKNFSFCRKSA